MTTTEITPLRHPVPVPGTDDHPVSGDDDTVWFTPAGPDDVDALHDLYERLSPESRRRRFFQPMPRVRRSIAAHLCTVDPARHIVRLARQGSPTGPVVAEVQVALDTDDPTRAELALAVDDEWSGRGLGRMLVAIAHELASRQGVETLTAEVLPENRPCVALLSGAGMRFTVSSGLLEGVGPVVASGVLPASGTFAPRPAPLAVPA